MGVFTDAAQIGLQKARDVSGQTLAQPPVPAPAPPSPVMTAPSPKPAPLPPSQPNTFMSGNILQKIFDIIRLPEFAQAGFVKGGAEYAKKKGVLGQAPFANPREILPTIGAGIKAIPRAITKRTEFGTGPENFNFAKEAGIQNRYGQAGANLGLSLAAPQLGLSSLAKGVAGVAKAIPGVEKVAGAVGKGVYNFAKETPAIAKSIESVFPYFKNPQFGKMVAAADEKLATRISSLHTTLKDLSKGLSPAEQQRVGQIIEGGVSTSDKYGAIAKAVNDIADKVGQEAVSMGLLAPDQFAKYKGQYMSHIWLEALTGKRPEALGALSSLPKVGSNMFKERKGAEGFIKEFAPATFAGLGSEIKAIEAGKLYQNIAKTFGVTAINPGQEADLAAKGYRYAEGIVKTKGGDLLNKSLLPKEVIDYLGGIQKVNTPGVYQKLLGAWKAGKTIWNPAYHVRNLLSNQILSDMSTGKGLMKTVVDYVGAVHNYAGGGNQKFVKAAQSSGLLGRQQYGAALNEFLDAAKLIDQGDTKKLLDLPSHIQNVSEETAKLNVFRSWMEKFAKEAKVSVDEALQNPNIVKEAVDKAQEAIFSPYRIGKAERAAAAKYVPFYSFTRQMTPFFGKTLAEHPSRITKYEKAKTAVEGLSQEPEGGKRPEYARNMVRLPTKGGQTFFDPSYILPYGNLGEGDLARGRLPLGLSFDPFVTEAAQQAFNKDLYFNQPIQTSAIPGKAARQRIEHAARTVLPSAYSTLGLPLTGLPEARGKLYSSFTGSPDYAGRQYSKGQAALSSLGIKTQTIRPEEQAKFSSIEKKKKLDEIRKEIGKTYRDQRLSSEEKRKTINDLISQQKIILSQ